MTGPWETPLLASTIWDWFPVTFTCNVRQLGKRSTQLTTMGAMPYPQSLSRMSQCLTEFSLKIAFGNLEMSFREDVPFLGLWLQRSHVDRVETGFWFPYVRCGLHERNVFLGDQLGIVCRFPIIRGAFGQQYSPRHLLLLLKAEVSIGSGGITRILPRDPGFTPS